MISAATASGSGIVRCPRAQASESTDSRTIPAASKPRATVDFPEPAGPHMKITLLIAFIAPA
ncbi:hypothetical protein GCM10023160_26620 [Brachybacterium paraconglomeratum]